MAKTYAEDDLRMLSLSEVRSIVRRGDWTDNLVRIGVGYAKFNLVVLPQELAYEFLLFSLRNPNCAHVSEVTDPGDPHPKILAPEADLRTDLPRYRVFKDGELIEEPTDVTKYWRDDLVAFLIGVGTNLISLLNDANVKHRMFGGYTTNVQTIPAGRFRCPLVVVGFVLGGSQDVVRATQISSRLPIAHFGPVHIGDPSNIGIKDPYNPDIFANTPSISPIESGEIPVFWGNGVTPQLAAIEAKIPFMITHKPAHYFIADRRVEELSAF